MFRLHQSTRRRICRTGFLTGCLAPLCALAVWGLVRHTPTHARQHELSLSQSLGLGVTVAGVKHPRPGVFRYTGLELSDAETGTLVAQCERGELASPCSRDTPAGWTSAM